MLRLIITVTFLICLTNCSNSDNKPNVVDNPISLTKDETGVQDKLEKQQKELLPSCVFDNPDTSISNIILRDANSATTVLKVNRLNSDTTYNFRTADEKEILCVTVHPGDLYSQISIFQVRYADNSKIKRPSLPINHFATEKNIKLGLTRNEVVAILGDCYALIDSTKDSITINYRLENPQDSRTNLLRRQKMPIYYGTYKFYRGKLEDFEFGFEYP